MIRPAYRYFLYTNKALPLQAPAYLLDRELFPVNGDNIRYREEFAENQIFKRKKMSVPLVFIDDTRNNVTDFSYFKSLEESKICDEFRITVQQWCKTGYKDYWNGYFSLAWGKWDEDVCQVTFELQPNDQYRCLLENSKTKFNILDLLNLQTLEVPNNIKLEYITCPSVDVAGISVTLTPCAHVTVTLGTGLGPPLINSFACITAGTGWMVYYSTYHTELIGLVYITSIETTWVREYEVTLDVGGQPNSPAGAGWIQDIATFIGPLAATKWVRMPYNGAYQTYTVALTCVVPTKVSFSWEPPPIISVHTRLRKWNDILLVMFSQCGQAFENIRSDFFDINSPDDQSINYVTGLVNNVRDILVEQKSDSLKPGATQGATFGYMSFDDLQLILRNMFNCFWDFVDGDIRIENLSYFTDVNGMDLTTLPHSLEIKASNKYEYDLKELPKFERWILAEAGNYDFIGVDVWYNSICVNQDADSNIKQYSLALISTDIDYIQRNPDDVSKDGFTFFCCSYNGVSHVLNNDIGLLSLLPQINGHFSLANLEFYYHRHGRVLPVGIMNNFTTNFLSWLRTKRQLSLNIVLCCDEDYNSRELMKSNLGWGQVDQSEFSTKGNTLAVVLKHY